MAGNADLRVAVIGAGPAGIVAGRELHAQGFTQFTIFEKAAVNVSVIRGVLSEDRARAMSARGRDDVDEAGGQPYEAEALSLVLHPESPLVPTLRADVRRFGVEGRHW